MTLLSDSFYQTFDPRPYNFPQALVPVFPKRLSSSMALTRSRSFEPVTRGAQVAFYSRARYALHEALRRLNVGPGTGVLMPAYHCRNMIDPVASLAAESVLYAMTDKLNVDLTLVDAALKECRLPVRAMLVTHFFGFQQDIATIKSWCDARGIAVIEDCSHAYFRPRDTSQLGRLGRYTITSPYKFCPTFEGGVLIFPEGDGIPALGGRSTREMLAAGLSIVRASRRNDAQAHAMPAQIANDPCYESDAGYELPTAISAFYARNQECRRGLRLAENLLALCNSDRIAYRRRNNYLRWVESVQGLPRGRALVPALPEDAVPYMFPLFLQHPELDFQRLKRAGVPIMRWDSIAVTNCKVSMNYRLSLIQLPCHQDLGERELEWMIAAVRTVLKENKEVQ